MPDVKLKTRIQNKYKTLNEWNEIAAGEFIPLKGEVCYAIDGNILYQKVGDGVTDFTELNWLISPSTQSDNSENDETSFAYIKNRLAYDIPTPVPEDQQLIKDMSKIRTITYSKETLHQALPDLAALLPTHIDNYLIEQLHMDNGDGVSDFNIFKVAHNSFAVDVNNIFTSEELLISEDQNFILMAVGNPVFINIWITLSGTNFPLYPMDYNLDKDYCVFFALSQADNSFYGTFIGDLNVYNADAYSLQLKHTIENSVVPIDDRFLTNSKSNWDEMDSSKVSYIYNKYGNIATAQLDNEMLNSYKTTILSGSFEINGKYADGYYLKNCSFGIQNWQYQYVGLPFKDFEVQITYNNGKNTSTYQNCAFYYGQDYLCKSDSNPLVFIGNPSFLSEAYYAYSPAFENLIIADQEDNGLPFLFGFDLSLDQPLVKCFLGDELISSDAVDYNIVISTSTIALATKMVPDYLIMKEKEPWIYDETKESLMTPTAYEASGIGSVAIGLGTSAIYSSQMVIGQYNVDDDKAFIIGQGDTYDNRKNIFSVDREGNVEATNFSANYVNENGEKSVISLSEIANKQNSKITPEQTTFFDTIPSQNLLDASTQKDGMLHTNGTIYTINDNISYENYKYFEQYIPVQEGDILALQCITYHGLQSSFDSNCAFARITAYNENKQVLTNLGVINTEANPQYFYNVPATVAFVRITLDWTAERSEIMVTKNATQVLPYQPYQGSYLIDQNYLPKINDTTKVNLPITEEGTLDYGIAGHILQTNGDGTTSWVEDDAMVDNITPEQTTFFEFEDANNLLDVSTVQTGMIHTNGRIYTVEDSASYGAYRYFEQYIPVNENDVLTVQWDYEGTRYSLVSMNTGFSRVTAYDENKNVLTNLGGLTNSSTKLTTYTVPATVAYVRITLSSNFDGWSNVALVKNTTGIVPYEEYGASGRSYIKSEYIKEKTKEPKEVLAFLPDEIVCAVGRTIEIYNNQVCPLADKYHIRWYSTVGKALERKYSITGDADFIGDYKLTFEIYDDDEMVIFAKDTTIKIVEDNIPESFIICPIGDSLTNGKSWLTEVPTLSNNKVSYVGTRGNGRHEGRSGFTSIGYTTAHDYTFEAANPETVHPFWDGTKFSWNYYKTNTGVSADAVQIFLGTNDLFGNTTGETLANNIKLMVDDIRSTEATMPIFIVLTILVGSQNGLGNQRASDGFTAMYKGKNKYLLDCKFIKAMKLLQETFKDYENLYFIPLTECHDNQYNFGEVETPVNPRATQTEIMPKEGIHPQQQGYEQMADVMYSVYCRAFAE